VLSFAHRTLFREGILMSSNLPDFDKAEYLGQTQTSAYPDQPLSSDIETFEQRADHDRFVHAIAYGAVASIVGSILYAAFSIVTHIQIAIAAMAVGYMVGRAMLEATHGLGGRKYQVAAALFTYFSVSIAAALQILWAYKAHGHDLLHINRAGLIVLTEFGLASPFLKLEGGLNGLIGLFILFIGIRFAWRMTADRRIPQ
jgi:hypothetical protein